MRRIGQVFINAAADGAIGPGCDLPDAMHRSIIFGKPDGMRCGVWSGYAIGLAIRCRRRKFIDHFICYRIKLPNFIDAQFGKPEMSELIKGQIKGTGACGSDAPLVPIALRIVFPDGIGDRLGKPEVPIAIKGKKKWAGVSSRHLELLHRGRVTVKTT